MRPAHGPAANGKRRDVDRLHPREIQRDDTPRDVDDRVDRAHVVELHRVAVGAVHPRFGIGEPREDARRALAHAGPERAPLEDVENVAKRPMLPMRPLIDLDIDLGRAKIPLHHLACDQRPPRERQLRQLGSELLERHASVQNRRHDHVPRRPTRTIEVSDPHPIITSRRQPTNLTLLSPTPKLYAYAQSHQANQPRISSAAPLAPAGAGGWGEGAWDPFPPRGNARARAQMEPSRRGHANARRVVPRPLAPPPSPGRRDVTAL